jgi:hypothetical protein
MCKRLRRLPLALVLLLLAAAGAGCNIFGFAANGEKSPVDKAEQAIRDGDYAKAKSELTDKNGALKDSTDSMVLYTYSKAVLLESGLNISKLVDFIQADKGVSSGSLSLLTEIDGLSLSQQNTWYQANREIAIRLSRIWNNQSVGEMSGADIALDYSVSSIVGGVLGIRDTNHNGSIDNGDLKVGLTEVSRVVSGTTVSGFDFTGITGPNAAGNTIVFPGLTAFLGRQVHSKPVLTADGVEGYSPDDINPFIATVLSFLNGGSASIDYFVQQLAQNTSYDPDQIKQYVPLVARYINFYWYDDGVDNDGDGRIDEEAIDGEDNDQDGFIDEDSDYMEDFDLTNISNTQYLALFEAVKNIK